MSDYFDDFQLLNVTHVRMNSNVPLPQIRTQHHYLGLMQGAVYIDEFQIETRPFIYFTPGGLLTGGGWRSPAKTFRDNFYIECSGPRADRIFSAFGALKSHRRYFIGNPESFTAILLEIQRLFTTGNPLRPARLVLCAEELAALLSEQIQPAGTGEPALRDIDELLAGINRNPGSVWNFSENAASAGLTLRHWNRLFTACVKIPPHRFVAQCRLRLARELLVSSVLPIKQIAEQCGFQGASEFSRFFRKNTGISPKNYRKTRML